MIYVCISWAMPDKDTECAAELEEVFRIVQMKQVLVVPKVGICNIVVCIRVGLEYRWRGYALLAVWDPLNYLRHRFLFGHLQG
jgi:hypothetical protein